MQVTLSTWNYISRARTEKRRASILFNAAYAGRKLRTWRNNPSLMRKGKAMTEDPRRDDDDAQDDAQDDAPARAEDGAHVAPADSGDDTGEYDAVPVDDAPAAAPQDAADAAEADERRPRD
jgi:hypothetical protein